MVSRLLAMRLAAVALPTLALAGLALTASPAQARTLDAVSHGPAHILSATYPAAQFRPVADFHRRPRHHHHRHIVHHG